MTFSPWRLPHLFFTSDFYFWPKRLKLTWADWNYELAFLFTIPKTLSFEGQNQFLDEQLSLITIIIIIRDEIMTSKMNFEGVDETECD